MSYYFNNAIITRDNGENVLVHMDGYAQCPEDARSCRVSVSHNGRELTFIVQGEFMRQVLSNPTLLGPLVGPAFRRIEHIARPLV